MSTTWDPKQYARFAGHRSRPFADLLARVGAAAPALVVDLGCGHGPLTLTPRRALAGRAGRRGRLLAADARVGPGAGPGGRVEWVQADLREWDPASLGQAPDVIVTNATLQWVPGHLDLLDAWVEALAAGGWFAMQVPGNFDAPSHRLMREAARDHPAADRLGPGSTGRGWRSLRPTCAACAGLRRRRVGDDLPARARPRGRAGQPGARVGARHRAASRARHADRRGRARRLPRRLRREAARGIPAGRGGVIFPFRRVFAVAQKKEKA